MVAPGRSLANLHHSLITPGLRVKELRSGMVGSVVRYATQFRTRGAVVAFPGGEVYVIGAEMETV